jgi:23S rRNA (pseudouridine1915-N3)-methyltransferase
VQVKLIYISYKNKISSWEQDYLKKISSPIKLEMKPLLSKKSYKRIEDQKRYEGDLFLSGKADSGQYHCFDKSGRVLSTEKFANFLNVSQTVTSLFIGGTYGIHNEIIDKASSLISIGKMEFTHELFRIMVLEQIYRVSCIHNNHPFHQI